MSLDGAKLICLKGDAAQHENVILAKGKTFKFGYYMDCDVLLEHPEALGLQCTIESDPFGRITIANLCKDHGNITLNGKPLRKLRPLLHNTEICIFDKKFLWLFEKSENHVEYATPSKKTKKAEQPPNSEPGRRWGVRNNRLNNRLTIHTFSYSIKSGQDSTADEAKNEPNKTPSTCETIETNSSEPNSTKRESPIPTAMVDLIDLETPKPKQRSFAGQRTPLLCFSLSETVITSYSPRDKSSRALAKSFAIVQSPGGTPRKMQAQSDVTLGPFEKTSSPLVLKHRPSMHLIDLTTPMKRAVLETPSKSAHKSAFKKNKLEQSGISHQTGRSANNTASSVFSVHSTDEESVIELSDDGGFSPSPVLKTPPRTRTPQSLMKRAILSSAKKTIRKPVPPPAAPPPLTLSTPKSPATTRGVRFHSQSTPQRKSFARIESSSVERTKASKSVLGKLAKSMITSTPFRADQVDAVKRRSSILISPSTSLIEGKSKSRTSLMLKQALTGSPKQSKIKKSLSSTEMLKTPSKSETKARKSVSFLKHVECEQPSEGTPTLNKTFSIEEIQDFTNDAKDASMSKNNATFSPEKESCVLLAEDDKVLDNDKTKEPTECMNEGSVHTSKMESSIVAETPIKKDTNRRSLIKPPSADTLNSKDKVTTVKVSSTILGTCSPRNIKNSLAELPEMDDSIESVQQTPHSSKSHLRKTPLSVKPSLVKNLRTIIDEENFEGLDSVFKTPKARNIMILSSPKSIALQKPSTDSVELKHSTEFDLSTHLDDLFKTPQSELLVNRSEVAVTTPVDEDDNNPTLSPEEAFDKLVGRSTAKKIYTRTNVQKQPFNLPLDAPRDLDLPKTDIEEWIEKVNESIEHSDVERDEDEMSYLTAEQSEVSRDPLMVSSVLDGITTTHKKKIMNKSMNDEIAMTIREDDEEITSVLRDPLEATVVTQLKKSISPNLSGIDLLDHSSDSTFSETLAISDDSSEKENDKHSVLNVQDNTVTQVEEHAKVSPNKASREIEEAFENFETERRILEEKRHVFTPEPKKTETNPAILNRRKTLGNSKAVGASFDVKSAKEKWEMEMAFKNFEDEPVVATVRAVKTPEPKKHSLKDHRRTMGTEFLPEKELDLEAAKAEREMELAFENFEEEPAVATKRAVKTPDVKKSSLKDHRRTMGTKFVPEKELDLEAAKAEREMELAFENFEEESAVATKRAVKTPDVKKSSLKDHRRTMGTKFVPEKELDLEAAKAEREMELAFENFEAEPAVATKRSVKTPDVKKSSLKDHRRTMGTKFVPEKELNLEAAKAEREMELAFENFEEEPAVATKRAVKTPDVKKSSLKDHRRTMGTKFVPEKELNLEAAKTEREMELAFENFEEEPAVATKRAVKTPDVKKSSLKDHRRTMGTKFVPEKELDLEAAKAEREMELAFENFEEEPAVATKRAVKTPDVKKSSLKDHRRTMGTKFVPEKELNLEAAKAEREMELAFENFEEEPAVATKRAVKTPDVKKSSLKDHRRTMGTKFVPEKELDLEAAKAERDMELAFENFEEEPAVATKRAVMTPDVKKSSLKDHRRTMGTKFVPEKELDLEAAKAEREMELAFENFEEEPAVATKRAVKTPDVKESSLKDHRRTMGTKFVPEKELDLEAAKAERDMELAFENFEEEPAVATKRAVMTPDVKKSSLKDHRRTMGTKFVPEKELDLEAAKAEREMELAFENFEEEPAVTTKRAVKTPDVKKSSLKDHRRTMGTKFVPEKVLDLEAAKAEREMELAFENFEEEPAVATKRAVKTPDVKKSSLKDHRRTMGTKFVPEKELDLEAAKAEREMELASENFKETPLVATKRAAKTPDVEKSSPKDHRRMIGTHFVPANTLDLAEEKRNNDSKLMNVSNVEMEELESPRSNKNDDPTGSDNHGENDQITRISDEVNLDKDAESQMKLASVKSRCLRRRLNTIDDRTAMQHVDAGVESTKKESKRAKTRRLNSAETTATAEDYHKTVELTDRTDEIQQITSDSQTEPDVQQDSSDSRKVQLGGRKRNRRIKSSEVESECTDDETKHEKTTRKNTGAKVKTLDSSQTYEEIHQFLDPIVEEVKRQNSVEESSLNEDEKQKEHKKSALNLHAEVDKNVIDANKCTRSVALSVVLLETSSSRIENTNKNIDSQIDVVCEEDLETRSIKIKSENVEDEFTNETKQDHLPAVHVEKEDTDEVISSTPATKANQRRRPQRKPDFVDVSGLGLRRTRRGSVQQEVDVKVEPVDDGLLYSTPGHSVVHSKIESTSTKAGQSTPARRRGRKQVGDEDLGEAIPSTPLLPKTRGRRGVQKPGVTSSSKNEDIKVTSEVNTDKIVTSDSISEPNTQTEVVDEIVPSTPLQQVRRGRKVKKLTSEVVTVVKIENDAHGTGNEGLVVLKEEIVTAPIEGTATEELNKVDNVESHTKGPDIVEEEDDRDGKTEGHDIEVPLNTNALRGKHKVEPLIEHAEVSKETQVESRKRGRKAAATTSVRNASRKRDLKDTPASEEAGPSTEIEKLDGDAVVKEEVSIIEESDETKISENEDLIEKNKTNPTSPTTPPRKGVEKRGISKTPGNHIIAKETEEIRGNVVSTENDVHIGEDKGNKVPTTSASTKPRTRRVGNKDEPQITSVESSTFESGNARARSRILTDQKGAENLTPIRRGGRGKRAIDAVTAVSTQVETENHSSEPKSDSKELELLKSQVLKENLIKDSVSTSTPARKRGRKGVLEKEVPGPEGASASNLDHKGGRRGLAEQDPENQTEEDVEKSIPARKRDRKANTKSELQESHVNMSTNAEVSKNDSTVHSASIVPQESNANKKRGRVENVKSELSESKTETPLRKRGRRQVIENDSTKTEVAHEESKSDLGSFEKDINVETVQPIAEMEEETGKVTEKPVRGRKPPSAKVSKKVVSDSELKVEPDEHTEKRPTRGRRALVKDDISAEVSSSLAVEELGDKLATEAVTDAEALKTKSDDTSEKKPTRSRRAPAKSTPEVSTSHAEEDHSHKLPSVAEVANTESEENSEKKSTRGRRAPAKKNLTDEVSSTLTEVASNVNAENIESEGKSEKKPIRTRRAPAKYNTSAEVSSSHTDDEHQKSKPASRPVHTRKATSKSVLEDATDKTSEAPSTAEEEHQESEPEPRTVRGRRAVKVSEAEETHTPTVRGRKPHTKTDAVPSEDDVEDTQTQKPTRSKRGAQTKSETPAGKNISKVIAEENQPSSLPKKATRSRKAAVLNEPSESDDESHQKDSTKKSSRSRKYTEPAVEDEAKVSKRGNRRIQEVSPDDDSSSTPKRPRRKPRA